MRFSLWTRSVLLGGYFWTGEQQAPIGLTEFMTSTHVKNADDGDDDDDDDDDEPTTQMLLKVASICCILTMSTEVRNV